MKLRELLKLFKRQIISVKNAVVEEVKLEQTKKKLDFTGSVH